MADGPNNQAKDHGFCVPWSKLPEQLEHPRLGAKIAEVVLSFIAFLCEELVQHCKNCPALYFFEFMSCTAFLLSIVVLVVYCTKVAEKVELTRVKFLDSWFTLIVGILFLIASIVFATGNYNTGLELTSVAFGFLASFAFLVDFSLLLKKEKVFPCKKEPRERNKPTEEPGSQEERERM